MKKDDRGWVGASCRNGEKRSRYRILLGEYEGEGHLKYLYLDGWILLKWILKE
jgi:hypothetical protein